MSIPKKRFLTILLFTALVLLIPLISMQFTSEVNWSVFDFLIAGLLLFGSGVLIEFILRKTKKVKNRFVLILILIIVFVLIWVELAVGLFGSPFAGS